MQLGEKLERAKTLEDGILPPVVHRTRKASLPAIHSHFALKQHAAASPALSTRSESVTSQTTLTHDEKVHEKAMIEQDEFKFLDAPVAPTFSMEEIESLRTKVELLELKIEKLQSLVHVRSILKCTNGQTLQWHSDPQRQAALEDWAIERIIAIQFQRSPESNPTIAELVRQFAQLKFLLRFR